VTEIEIKRVGPPTARDVHGRMYTWTLPLNAMPPREWRTFFVQTKDTTITCHPHKVHIYQGLLIFESAEDDVPTWIGFIDKWMANANQRFAAWADEQRRRRGDAADTRERSTRLLEVNERFKNL
jgi:hypothetical protein